MTESCPNCDYSMRGLPDRHNCPECGFAYDRSADVIRCGSRFVGVGVLLAGIAFLGSVTSLINEDEVDRWDVVNVVSFGMALIIFVMVFKRRRRAVIGDGGIALIGYDSSVTSLAWRDVGRVEYGRFGCYARIADAHGVGHVDVGRAFFGSEKKVRAFIASANEWLARYRAESERAGEMSA